MDYQKRVNKLNFVTKYIPKVIRSYPGKYADVRLGKQIMRRGFTGGPTFIKGRGELLYSGAGKNLSWGGYARSWEYYNLSLASEFNKISQYPYSEMQFMSKRPRYIEFGRTYYGIEGLDEAVYVTRGYTKSYFRPQLETEKSFLFKPSFDITRASKIFISDKYIGAEFKTSLFKFGGVTKVVDPVKTVEPSSPYLNMLLGRGKVKDISRYSWYQEPLRELQYTTSSYMGGRLPDAFSMAYGRISLGTLSFLEEGIGVSSAFWVGTRPVISSRVNLGSINDLWTGNIPEVGSMVITGLDVTPVTRTALDSRMLLKTKLKGASGMAPPAMPETLKGGSVRVDIVKRPSTGVNIPFIKLEEEYNKKLNKQFRNIVKFGKGWRKRLWFKNMDVF